MSETRMTDEELNALLTVSADLDPTQNTQEHYRERIFRTRYLALCEMRRARAAETDLAAQLAASQAECEGLRSERDAAREALAPFARYPGDYQFRRDPDEAVIWRHDTGPVLTVGDWHKARAALSPPAPKGEAQAKEGAETEVEALRAQAQAEREKRLRYDSDAMNYAADMEKERDAMRVRSLQVTKHLRTAERALSSFEIQAAHDAVRAALSVALLNEIGDRASTPGESAKRDPVSADGGSPPLPSHSPKEKP